MFLLDGSLQWSAPCICDPLMGATGSLDVNTVDKLASSNELNFFEEVTFLESFGMFCCDCVLTFCFVPLDPVTSVMVVA